MPPGKPPPFKIRSLPWSFFHSLSHSLTLCSQKSVRHHPSREEAEPRVGSVLSYDDWDSGREALRAEASVREAGLDQGGQQGLAHHTSVVQAGCVRSAGD